MTRKTRKRPSEPHAHRIAAVEDEVAEHRRLLASPSIAKLIAEDEADANQRRVDRESFAAQSAAEDAERRRDLAELRRDPVVMVSCADTFGAHAAVMASRECERLNIGELANQRWVGRESEWKAHLRRSADLRQLVEDGHLLVATANVTVGLRWLPVIRRRAGGR